MTEFHRLPTKKTNEFVVKEKAVCAAQLLFYDGEAPEGESPQVLVWIGSDRN